MKDTFTKQEMKEAWEMAEAVGANKFVMDERNDGEVIENLRKQFKRHKLPNTTFEQWMTGRFRE